MIGIEDKKKLLCVMALAKLAYDNSVTFTHSQWCVLMAAQAALVEAIEKSGQSVWRFVRELEATVECANDPAPRVSTGPASTPTPTSANAAASLET